MTAVRASATAS
uniref:Uncharacterized protein n=1 Tax=Anguilla anguilla TaxID=7936 RepID=A0A0E9U3M3_ANGAN